MRVYHLKPEDVGLDVWPDSLILPSGVEVVTRSDDADLLWCPASLHGLEKQSKVSISQIASAFCRPERTVFTDVSDLAKTYYSPALMIRCNARKWMCGSAPNTYGFAWPVEPHTFGVLAREPVEFQFDVGFCGWVSTSLCQEAVRACQDERLTHNFTMRSTFWGYLEKSDPPEAALEREEYLKCLRACRLHLCVESIPGVWRYRVWESLAAGRVPLCFISESFVQPFAEEWDMADCMFVRDISQAGNAGRICKDILGSHNDSELVEMGRAGHEVWNRWMHRDKWGDLVRLTSERHLRELRE